MADGSHQESIGEKSDLASGGICGLVNELINQHENAINQGGYKNTPGRFIPVGIDIYGKQDGIGQQRDAADGSKQLNVGVQNIKIFPETDGPAEHPEVINNHSQQGAEYAQENAQFQIVFFEYQNFQNFSSLVFKT